MLIVLDSASHSLAAAGELSPFFRDTGEAQGRISLADGSTVYELGHAELEDGFFSVGDFHEVTQTVAAFNAQAGLARVAVVIVTPATLPSGLEWEFSARLNGAVTYSRRLGSGSRSLSLSDVAVSLAASAPPDALSFRLEVVVA